jgi:hypothetical protein
MEGQATFALSSGTARGSYTWDSAHGYTLSWPSWHDFESWQQQEQRENGIEFVSKECRKGSSDIWKEKRIFVCSRQGSGSIPKYAPKNPERERNIPSKRSGCPCRLTVKTYPNVGTVLANYTNEHSHDIGIDNIRFTRISLNTRNQIRNLLHLGVENDQIVG